MTTEPVTEPTPSVTARASRGSTATRPAPGGRPPVAEGTETASTADQPPTHCPSCRSWLFEDHGGRLYCLAEGCERHRQTAGHVDRDAGELAAALEGAQG